MKCIQSVIFLMTFTGFLSCQDAGTPAKKPSNTANQGGNEQFGQFEGQEKSDGSGNSAAQQLYTDGSDQNICDVIKASTAVVNRAPEEIGSLCERISDLRNPEVIYKGEPSAKIVFSGEKIPGQESVSRAIIISSLQQKNTPLYFAKKVRLEVSDHIAFRNLKFEMTPDEDYIDFETIDVSGAVTDYRYTNRTEPDTVITYIGKSTFHTIIPDKLYVIVSKAEETVRTIKEFTAVIIVHAHPKVEGDIEVFAYTKESYENFGGHDALMSKLRKKFADEQMRGYRNGIHAREIDLQQ
jgi:hypothetical protein